MSFIFLFIPFWLFSQNASKKSPDPYFEAFEGTAYKMPVIEKKQGKLISKRIQEKYGKNIYDYPIIGNIQLDKIQIEETPIAYGEFPGVDRSVGFAMILNSKMYIKQKACYEFSLDSDDGSILWLNEIEVLNNDGGHKMRLKKDSLILDRGEYDVKLWYFQGMPDRFGFLFDSKFLGDTSVCSRIMSTKEYVLDGNILFDSGSYELEKRSTDQLKALADSILQHSPKAVYIHGHTDSVGDPESNMILSQKRADSVRGILQWLVSDDRILFLTEGRGESEPKASNDTKEGRAINRRVELRFSKID